MLSVVTRQNLLEEKTRFFISVGGVALSVFLIAFLLSLYQGWNLQVGSFVHDVKADMWVSSEGTTNFLNPSSILPEETGTKLSRIAGVQSVDPLIVRPMAVNNNHKQYGVHLVGYQTAGGAGGPTHVKSGKSPPGPDEVVVDQAFERKSGLGIGDTISIGGQPVTIVGISSGGNLVFSQTIFVPIETAQRLLNMSGLITFYLVHLSSGANDQQTIDTIRQSITGTDAFTKSTFTEETRNKIMGNIVPILVVVLALAFVVGVAVTGLTIYNATVEKAREYGILKALGFKNSFLFRLVLEQSLITCALGFVIGAGLTALATRFVVDVVPQFVTLLRWQDILAVLGTTMVMSVIAALLPVRRITSVDPVTVFSA